jgi:uncharacterized RDD family membrane protein YckC
LGSPSASPPPPSIPEPTPAFVSGPPTIPIPESAKRKPSTPAIDEDAVKAGDIAPFNTRIIAGAIDWGIGLCLYIVLVKLLPGSMLDFLASAVWLGYLLTKDSLPFLDGQSVGKRIMKLRAVTADGQPLTGNWQTGILRNAFLVIAPVEFVILLVREEKPEAGRRLGDDIAKTKVIVVGDPVAPVPPEE